MALAATNYVDRETISLDIMLAIRMATKPAWKAGWDPNVTKVMASLVHTTHGFLLCQANTFSI